MKTEVKKPKAKVIGQDGNIFNLIGICRRALYDAGLKAEGEELMKRVMASESHDEALNIMGEYCELY